MRHLLIIFVAFFACQSLQAQIDSLDIKIGQMIMVGMQGYSVDNNSSILTDIKKGIIGGILLYERNLSTISTAQNLTKLTNKLKNAASIPLLISIDQEGGQVNRLKQKYGFKAMPSAKTVGDKNNDRYTKEVGNTIASTLFECGINVNYAPTIDVHNPQCPVLGKRQRCYSANADIIAHHAGITIDAHHENKVMTVIKHFPGHGNSMTDSHLGVADVTRQWKENELKPYKILIDQGKVDLIMTAHIVNRKLDSSGLPATLSKKIINGLLRTKMNYQGVIISDDMQMHAISSHYGFDESVRMCIDAGVDILMFSNNIADAQNYSPQNVHSTIKRLIKEGKISEARINESYTRIIKLKQRNK